MAYSLAARRPSWLVPVVDHPRLASVVPIAADAVPDGPFLDHSLDGPFATKTLVVTDIDDTLVGDPASLSVFLATLRSLRDSVMFAVATGRHYSSAIAILSQLGVLPECSFIITAVGTEIYARDDVLALAASSFIPTPPDTTPTLSATDMTSPSSRSSSHIPSDTLSFSTPTSSPGRSSSSLSQGNSSPSTLSFPGFGILPKSSLAFAQRRLSSSTVSSSYCYTNFTGSSSSYSYSSSSNHSNSESTFPDRIYLPDKSWTHLLLDSDGWNRSAIESCLSEFAWLSLQPPDSQSPLKVSFHVDQVAFDAAFPSMSHGSEAWEVSLFLRDLVSAALRKRGLTRCMVLISYSSYLDVVPTPASKRGALLHLQSRFGFGRMVVAGDSGNDEDMLTEPSWDAILVRNHAADLDHLRGKKRIFLSKHPFAKGILDGLKHYGVLSGSSR